ncbi:Dehydrogenase RED2 [Paramyrothecium foliicola]|nr:Dehydrogenase RED2 [Paramyrothecium foliicola]
MSRLIRIILSPFPYGFLLFAVVYSLYNSNTGPSSTDGPSSTSQGAIFLQNAENSNVWVALCWFLVVATLYQINSTLNYFSHNSWAIKNSRQWDWPKEIAVITGGSGGIGTAIIEELLALGVQVAVLDIQEPHASVKDHPRVSYFSCNISDSSAVAAAAQSIQEKIGHPSILINNTGVMQDAPILKTSEPLLRNIFNSNCISMWFTVQQFLPDMIKQNKGHIVTMASVCSFSPVASCRLFNVLTTIVHPSYVRTPMINHLIKNVARAGFSVLYPKEVATEVVKQIKRRQGGMLVLPLFVSIIATLRTWPYWMQQLLHTTVGGTLAKLGQH